MATERGLRLTGGYLGIALLASMITLAVMLVLFTDPGPTTRIEVGIPIREACDTADTGGTGGSGLCFAAEVTNIGDRAGLLLVRRSRSGGRPRDVPQRRHHGQLRADRPARGPSPVLIRMDLYDGVRAADVSPPGLECVPA